MYLYTQCTAARFVLILMLCLILGVAETDQTIRDLLLSGKAISDNLHANVMIVYTNRSVTIWRSLPSMCQLRISTVSQPRAHGLGTSARNHLLLTTDRCPRPPTFCVAIISRLLQLSKSFFGANPKQALSLWSMLDLWNK